MRDLGRRSVFLFAVIALFMPASAALADGDAELSELRDWFQLVSRFDALPEGRRPLIDPSFDALFTDLEQKIRAARSDSEDWKKLGQEFYVLWADSRFRTAEEKKSPELVADSFELDGKILGWADSGEIVLPPDVDRTISARSALREEASADRATGKEIVVHLGAARRLHERAGNSAKAETVRIRILDIEAQPTIASFRAGDYDAAYTWLKERENELEGSEAAKIWDELLRTTCPLVLKPIAVQQGRDLFADHTVVLIPEGGGKSIEWDGVRRRIPADKYTIRVSLKGGRTPTMELPASLERPGEAPNEVRLPTRIPKDMVFIEAGPGPDGRTVPAFFIDRMEVAAGDFAGKVARKSFWKSDKLAAYGVTFEEANDYASKVGKKLPTIAQWMRAAFGSERRKFPWEGAGYENRTHMRGRGAPTDARPSAADADRFAHGPFNLFHMVGNVWEWVYRDPNRRGPGWAIGAGYRGYFEDFEKEGWNVFDDPWPGEKAYKALDVATREKHFNWRVRDKTEREVGFRCVIELQ